MYMYTKLIWSMFSLPQDMLQPIVDIPADQQQLSINGTILVNQNTLRSYNVNSQSTVHIN